MWERKGKRDNKTSASESSPVSRRLWTWWQLHGTGLAHASDIIDSGSGGPRCRVGAIGARRAPRGSGEAATFTAARVGPSGTLGKFRSAAGTEDARSLLPSCDLHTVSLHHSPRQILHTGKGPTSSKLQLESTPYCRETTTWPGLLVGRRGVPSRERAAAQRVTCRPMPAVEPTHSRGLSSS